MPLVSRRLCDVCVCVFVVSISLCIRIDMFSTHKIYRYAGVKFQAQKIFQLKIQLKQ